MEGIRALLSVIFIFLRCSNNASICYDPKKQPGASKFTIKLKFEPGVGEYCQYKYNVLPPMTTALYYDLVNNPRVPDPMCPRNNNDDNCNNGGCNGCNCCNCCKCCKCNCNGNGHRNLKQTGKSNMTSNFIASTTSTTI